MPVDVNSMTSIINCTKPTLTRYCKRGLPNAVLYGEKKVYFDPLETYGWLLNMKSSLRFVPEKLERLLAHLGMTATQAKKKLKTHGGIKDYLAPSGPPVDIARESLMDEGSVDAEKLVDDKNGTFEDVLLRARKHERLTAAVYLRRLNAGDILGANRLHKTWVDGVSALRQLEVDASKIRKNKDESISREDHERVLTESHSLVASAMLQGAKSMAADLVDEVEKHEDHGAKVRAAYVLLDVELKKMRRSLAAELAKIEDVK